MSAYVFSTLANDQLYRNYVAGEGGVNLDKATVHIKGGTGVANDRLVTPLGVMTEVSDEQLEQLEQNHGFQMHKKNGFITVQKKKADPEKVAGDMNAKDASAPLTPSDYDNQAEEAPKLAGNAA